MASSKTVVDAPTFARELADLMASHRSLWLADALPLGPLLVWAGGRPLAATLCATPERTVVLLEPSEAAAAAAMRRGCAGLRAVHVPGGHLAVPDLGGLGLTGFAGIVVVPDSTAELGALLPQLLRHGAADCAVCVVVRTEDAVPTAAALRSVGRHDVATLHQSVLACSRIAPEDVAVGSRVRTGSGSATAEMALVTSGLAARWREGEDTLLGHDAGETQWRTGVEQMASTIALLDRTVDERTGSRLLELEHALEEALARCAAAERSNEEWAAQVDLLHRSTSWRVTAPLRRLTGLARSK